MSSKLIPYNIICKLLSYGANGMAYGTRNSDRIGILCYNIIYNMPSCFFFSTLINDEGTYINSPEILCAIDIVL